MIKGPHIKKGLEIRGAEIIDLAPTILYLMGLSVPNNMDGQVLTEIFNESFVKSNPVKYSGALDNAISGSEEKNISFEENGYAIKKRLEDLGYLG